MKEKCGSCGKESTRVVVLTGSMSVIVRCCEACKRSFRRENIPATILVEEIDEKEVVVREVMEDCAVLRKWSMPVTT